MPRYLFKQLVFLFILSCATSIHAQTPGYMGKRLLVSGMFGSFPALFSVNHNYSDEGFRFAIRYTGDIDYIVSRNGSLGFTMDVIKTARIIDDDDEIFGENYITNFNNPYNFLKIRGLSYSLNYKFFRLKGKGALAPVGPYFKITAGLIHTTSEPVTGEGVTLDDEDFIARHLNPLFTFTGGTQRVLFDNFVFKFSGTYGWVPGGVIAYFKDINNEGEALNIKDRIRHKVRSRLAAYYLFNVNVGIGFIIPYRQKVP